MGFLVLLCNSGPAEQRELISDAQPLFFRPSCSSRKELPTWRRDPLSYNWETSTSNDPHRPPLSAVSAGRVVSASAPWL